MMVPRHNAFVFIGFPMLSSQTTCATVATFKTCRPDTGSDRLSLQENDAVCRWVPCFFYSSVTV
jgi:hypothetical protein